MVNNMEYIYESPDGDKTVYRYPIGQYDKRELVPETEPQVMVSDDGTVTVIE